ncbi:MAG TPA: class I SAM-dependent methyltransferase [Polyangiaceae bacterium]|nr:class I SAM-dependent methyltransferase [Polyangiaceae bacterium]
MAAGEPEVSIEDFLRYFPHTPAALAVKECARLTELRRYACEGPILDVGCGDGLFASLAFEGAEVWGIDIDAHEGRWAVASRAYAQIILGDITSARLPADFFATCVANCSLEHVPRLDLALKTIRDSLRPGARAFLFVPDRGWARAMVSIRTLSALGMTSMATVLEDSINALFKHRHLYDADGWRQLVAESGLVVEEVKPVLSAATTVAFEALLIPSLAGWLNKHLTTRWTNFPGARRLLGYPTYALVRALLDNAAQERSAEYLVVARRAE